MSLSYTERAVRQARTVNPYYHTSTCLDRRVTAFCDDRPDPGCTCGGDERVRRLNEGER